MNKPDLDLDQTLEHLERLNEQMLSAIQPMFDAVYKLSEVLTPALQKLFDEFTKITESSDDRER